MRQIEGIATAETGILLSRLKIESRKKQNGRPSIADERLAT
jgi:hypothetical protein